MILPIKEQFKTCVSPIWPSLSTKALSVQRNIITARKLNVSFTEIKYATSKTEKRYYFYSSMQLYRRDWKVKEKGLFPVRIY